MLFLLQLPIMLELAPPSDHLRIFPPVKLHFCFWCMRISQNLETLLQIYISIFLSMLRLVLLPNLSSSVLSPVNCGRLTFQEREKFNLQRAVGEQRNWQCIFPQNVSRFLVCSSGRIGQNFQNEVSVIRSIVPEFVAQQLNNLNRKLRGVRISEIINLHRSVWNEIGPIHRQRANTPYKACTSCKIVNQRMTNFRTLHCRMQKTQLL